MLWRGVRACRRYPPGAGEPERDRDSRLPTAAASSPASRRIGRPRKNTAAPRRSSVPSCSMRSTTTQPACSPIATAMLPVSARVRLKISPTMSQERNESNTNAGCASGENERSNRSKPLPQPTSSGAIRDLRKEVQDRVQGRGEQGGGPRSRFPFDRRMHGAAHHGFLEQRDGNSGTQTNEENAREIQRGRCEAWGDDAQVRRPAEKPRRPRRWRCRSHPMCSSP